MLRRLAVVLALAGVAFSGFLAACESSDFVPIPIYVPKEAGATSANREEPIPVDPIDPDDPGDGGAGAACDAAPKLRDNTDIYCRNKAGKTLFCKPTEGNVCCSEAKSGTTFVDGECVPKANDCVFPGESTGGVRFECTQSSHCGGGACCLVKSASGGTPRPSPDTKYPGCGTYFMSSNAQFYDGTRCQASCGAGEVQLCGPDDTCGAGTCRPGSIAGRNNTGVCIE